MIAAGSDSDPTPHGTSRAQAPSAEVALPARSWSSLALTLFLAWHSLTRSRLALTLLIGAVAIGVGLQVPNTANMKGYSAELLDYGVASGYGDVRVRPERRATFADADAVAARIRAIPGVRAATPLTALPGAVGQKGAFRGAPIYGVDLAADARPFRLVAGQEFAPGDEMQMLVGTSLAAAAGVAVGDEVQLRVLLDAAPDPLGLEDEPSERLGRYSMRVSGLVTGSSAAYASAFVDRGFLERETGLPGSASIILVYATEHSAARALAADIERACPDVHALTWDDDDPFFPSAIRSSQVLGRISEGMVTIAVLIPVLALLYINMLSRRRDVGLLCALGFRPGDIFATFILQSLAIGLVGIVLGCAIGYAIVAYFQLHPLFQWQGFEVRPVVAVATFARPALVVLVATVAAGVYPAWRAAKVDPARVLRGLE